MGPAAFAPPAFRKREDPRCDRSGGRGVRDEARRRPAPCHVGQRRGLVIDDEGQPANAAFGVHHERLTEGAFVKAEPDGEPRAEPFVLARRHRLAGDEQIVQRARARQPGVVTGIEHALRARERAFGVLDGERLQKALGADAGPAAKQTLEMVRAEPKLARDALEIGLRLVVVLDKTERLLDPVVVAAGGIFGRLSCHRLDRLWVSVHSPPFKRPGGPAPPGSCAWTTRAREAIRPAAPPASSPKPI